MLVMKVVVVVVVVGCACRRLRLSDLYFRGK